MFKYPTLLTLIATGSLHVYAQSCGIDDIRSPSGTYLDKIPERCVDLDLEAKFIRDAEATALAAALRQNETLKSLDLSNNYIGPEGAKALAKALWYNTLVNLSLEDNQIGDTGAGALADALKDNKTLELLDLSDNGIGDAGASQLAAAMKIPHQLNGMLQVLYLEENNIEDHGAIAIAKALYENHTLKYLNLNENMIEYEGARALRELQVNKSGQMKIFYDTLYDDDFD